MGIQDALLRNGGTWLSKARNWMHTHIEGVSRMEWTSTQRVSLPLCDLTHLASAAASGAIMDEREQHPAPAQILLPDSRVLVITWLDSNVRFYTENRTLMGTILGKDKPISFFLTPVFEKSPYSTSGYSSDFYDKDQTLSNIEQYIGLIEDEATRDLVFSVITNGRHPHRDFGLLRP